MALLKGVVLIQSAKSSQTAVSTQVVKSARTTKSARSAMSTQAVISAQIVKLVQAAILVVLALATISCSAQEESRPSITGTFTAESSESSVSGDRDGSGSTTPSDNGTQADDQEAANGTQSNQSNSEQRDLIASDGYRIPPAPDVPAGPVTADIKADLDALYETLEEELRIDTEAVSAVASGGDARTAWIISDFMRFAPSLNQLEALAHNFETVTGVDPSHESPDSIWKRAVDLLIAWDLPAIPDYLQYKQRLYTLVEPGWEPFFADTESAIDWRWIGWGGVRIDDRPLGDAAGCPRGCIPALDDPEVTPAAEGGWYPDDRIVFGVTINGESRAYPKNQMEVHEMINDTLGGRRLGMPYCTLCGSAQAYFTDQVNDEFDTPVLRTSGLLSRSNKVMYDLLTKSVFDTFTGEAVSGPLHKAGVRLEQATVVASTWGAWKEAHPDTTILASDGGLGRTYSLDPLGGRDDDGPIFPVGDVDLRLEVQELVVGIELGGGGSVAFPREAALEVLAEGGEVTQHGVRLLQDGDGLRAVNVDDGTEIPTHQAFWFAWSQFWPDTYLWSATS